MASEMVLFIMTQIPIWVFQSICRWTQMTILILLECLWNFRLPLTDFLWNICCSCYSTNVHCLVRCSEGFREEKHLSWNLCHQRYQLCKNQRKTRSPRTVGAEALEAGRELSMGRSKVSFDFIQGLHPLTASSMWIRLQETVISMRVDSICLTFQTRTAIGSYLRHSDGGMDSCSLSNWITSGLMTVLHQSQNGPKDSFPS